MVPSASKQIDVEPTGMFDIYSQLLVCHVTRETLRATWVPTTSFNSGILQAVSQKLGSCQSMEHGAMSRHGRMGCGEQRKQY
jgi:hypothetical protein